MLHLNLNKEAAGPLTILCVGAHSDDIEIGCGGTLLYLKTKYQLQFYWIVVSASGPRREEAARAVELFAAGSEKNVVLKDFRDGFLPYAGAAVKDLFETFKSSVKPDLIFTHWGGDAHQDHRFISELTWNTFRDNLILEYEIPKYDGDLSRPNLYVPLETTHYEDKVRYLVESFQSQHAKRWFSRETFMGLMRIRGMESNSPSGYAEAFHVRKILLT